LRATIFSTRPVVPNFAQAPTRDKTPRQQALGWWAAGALYSGAVEFVPRLSAVQIVVTPPPGGQRV